MAREVMVHGLIYDFRQMGAAPSGAEHLIVEAPCHNFPWVEIFGAVVKAPYGPRVLHRGGGGRASESSSALRYDARRSDVASPQSQRSPATSFASNPFTPPLDSSSAVASGSHDGNAKAPSGWREAARTEYAEGPRWAGVMGCLGGSSARGGGRANRLRVKHIRWRRSALRRCRASCRCPRRVPLRWPKVSRRVAGGPLTRQGGWEKGDLNGHARLKPKDAATFRVAQPLREAGAPHSCSGSSCRVKGLNGARVLPG